MCGIIGYAGNLEAESVLLTGLEQLEYRGYDSAGVAFFEESGGISLKKCKGQVTALKALCREQKTISHCGIGHTRWATHGKVTDLNAHPHQAGRVTLIHNGIIENYQELAKKFDFAKDMVSETDSEAGARLIDYFYDRDPAEAIFCAVALMKGSYGFCVMFADIPDKIYCIRSISPLVAAATDNGNLVASDLTALLPYSRQYFVVPEGVLMTIGKEGITLNTANGKAISPGLLEADWDTKAAMKNGFPFFMEKEIHEQPEAIEKTVLPRIKDGLPDFTMDGIPDSLFTECEKIFIVACGTAMYAGMVGKTLMEPKLRIPVLVQIASEFRYDQPLVDEKTLTIVISQSGETIDTLAALRLAGQMGSKVLSIVNVKGSVIARESDYVLYTHAGPEIAVASTKAYSVQLATLYLLTCKMGLLRGNLSLTEGKEFMKGFFSSISAVKKVLEQSGLIEKASEQLLYASDAYFIGRGLDYAFSLEGSLKLKEISYIHAEAYAAGELKHGTIALIEENTPVIAIATQSNVFEKTLSNVQEVKARGAYVILITRENIKLPDNLADIQLMIPDVGDAFIGLPTVIILQLLAYYTSKGKGLDVDKPRNLAKSVTVE